MKVHEIDDGYEVEFVGKVLDKTSGPGEVEIMKFQWKKAVQLLNINEFGECGYRSNARRDLKEHINNTHRTKVITIGRKGNLKVKCVNMEPKTVSLKLIVLMMS